MEQKFKKGDEIYCLSEYGKRFNGIVKVVYETQQMYGVEIEGEVYICVSFEDTCDSYKGLVKLEEEKIASYMRKFKKDDIWIRLLLEYGEHYLDDTQFKAMKSVVGNIDKVTYKEGFKP